MRTTNYETPTEYSLDQLAGACEVHALAALPGASTAEARMRNLARAVVGYKQTVPEDWDSDGWKPQASCRTVDPDTFFVAGSSQNEVVKHYCVPCPVRSQCLIRALVKGDNNGVSGATERDRRRFLREHGDSFRSWLAVNGIANNTK